MTAPGAATVNPANVLAMLDREVARDLKRAARQIEANTAERDRLIVEAHKAGASSREIAAHAGITHVAVWKIIQRKGGGK